MRNCSLLKNVGPHKYLVGVVKGGPEVKEFAEMCPLIHLRMRYSCFVGSKTNPENVLINEISFSHTKNKLSFCRIKKSIVF